MSELIDVLRRPRPRPATAEERLRVLEDEAEIRELIRRYATLTDLGAVDELLDLCTEDVERVLGGTLDQEAKGKADLRVKMAEPVRVRGSEARIGPAGDEQPASHHLITDEVIRVDGDAAVAVAQFAVVLTLDGERGQHEGWYRFDLRREAGRWRFARQLIVSNSAYNPMLRAR